MDTISVVETGHTRPATKTNGGYTPATKANGKPYAGRRSSRRHRFRNGERRAVRQALTAANLYICGAAPTVKSAAMDCGVSVNYVRAVLVLHRAGRFDQLEAALYSRTSLLITAAKSASAIAALVVAYDKASAGELATFGKTVGVGEVWDRIIIPAL